ncbi:GIY-YIG nuclease family protein [Moheibacter sp.]|uniref:GIY-YIG nuclease family protein n=1 Tax=Moheibacter sp. TaxID=1965316 RepID=UPI003C788528
MAFYVYILYSKSKDIYYKGFSENPQKRFTEHLEGKSQYTSQINDWELVLSEVESKKCVENTKNGARAQYSDE